MQDSLNVNLSSGAVTLTESQFRGDQTASPQSFGYFHFNCISGIAGSSLSFPVSSPQRPRIFSVTNAGSNVMAVLGNASAIQLLPGVSAVVFYDGADVSALSAVPIVVDYTTLDAELNTSPQPAAGLCYIVGAGTGDFSGQDNNIAVSRGGGNYSFLTPHDGQIVRTKDLNASPNVPRLIYWDSDAGSWTDV